MIVSVERVAWPILVAGAIVTLVLSLSVHAVMIQGLHVPFPSNFPQTGWARLPDGILSVLGAMYLSTHLPDGIRGGSFRLCCAVMFVCLAAIHEDLFRGPFMEFINLSNFTLYPFVDNIPKLIPFAVIAICVEIWTRRGNSVWASVIAAAVIAGVAILLVKPLANDAFAGVIEFTGAREGHQRYGLPYDWHILVPAYLTFIEPVIAALVIGLAVREKLPAAPLARFGLTAALILALKGPVFAPFLNVHYANTNALTAILSYAQFSFETIALGILTALTLQFACKAAQGKAQRAWR